MEQATQLEHLIHRWGNSISEALLDSSAYHSFHTPEVEGVIGYQISHDCAVVFGDPICAEEHKPVLAQAFHEFCQQKNLSPIYFIASESFSKWAIQRVSSILIEVGEEFIFDSFEDLTKGSQASKLRNKINHAQHIGLTVKEYQVPDPQLEKAILEVGKTWQKARKGPQIYLSHLNFFENRDFHRWFYLEDADQNIIGMALLSRFEIFQGWLLKFLITKPEVARGASELLMISILNTLKQENCHFVTCGMIPADRLGEIVGMGNITKTLARAVFFIAKTIFNLGKRKTYWKQFHPQSQKSYLLFSGSLNLKKLLAITKAMNIDL